LRDLVAYLITQFGKAPGFASLAFASLLSASLLTATGCLTGAEYVAALTVILGAHFGGGVLVAKRDNGKAAPGNSGQIEGAKAPADGPGKPGEPKE